MVDIREVCAQPRSRAISTGFPVRNVAGAIGGHLLVFGTEQMMLLELGPALCG
jgi:hypothetical protein